MFSTNTTTAPNILISSSDMVYLVGSDLQQKHMFILKTDLNGNIIWQRKYYRDCNAPHQTIVLENGPYLSVLGQTNTLPTNCLNPRTTWYVMNLDTATGNILQQFVRADTNKYHQTIMDAVVLPDHSIIAIGLYLKDYLAPNDSDFIFISKFDQNLNTIWSKVICGYKEIELYSIVISNNNDLFISGTYEPYVQFDKAAVLMKIDTSGTIHWAKHFDVQNSGFVLVKLAIKDSFLFACGAFIDNLTGGWTGALLKYDTLGNLISAFRYADFLSNVYLVNDSTLILQTGGKLIVSDINLNNTSMKGLPFNRQCQEFEKSSSGNLYGVGGPFTLIKFDSTFSTCLNQSYTYSRIPITSFVDSSISFQEFQYDYDSIGILYSDSIFFSPVELCNSTNNITDEYFDEKIILFPNPANTCIKISGSYSIKEDSYYQITDLSGKLLMHGYYTQGECINIEFLSKGYYLFILHDKSTSTLKFVKT